MCAVKRWLQIYGVKRNDSRQNCGFAYGKPFKKKKKKKKKKKRPTEQFQGKITGEKGTTIYLRQIIAEKIMSE